MTVLAAPLAVHEANYTAMVISVGIIFTVGVIAVVVASYFRLQGHPADAAAMAATQVNSKSPRTTPGARVGLL